MLGRVTLGRGFFYFGGEKKQPPHNQEKKKKKKEISSTLFENRTDNLFRFILIQYVQNYINICCHLMGMMKIK